MGNEPADDRRTDDAAADGTNTGFQMKATEVTDDADRDAQPQAAGPATGYVPPFTTYPYADPYAAPGYDAGAGMQEHLRLRHTARMNALFAGPVVVEVSLERLFIEVLAALVYKYRWLIITVWLMVMAFSLFGIFFLLLRSFMAANGQPFDGFDGSQPFG